MAKQLIKIAEFNADSKKSMNELMTVLCDNGYTVVMQEDCEDYFYICKSIEIPQEN